MPHPLPHTIPAEHLQLALAACKLRAHNAGATCALAATTAAPLWEVDCHYRRPHLGALRDAALSPAMPRVKLLQRGHLAALIERTARRSGVQEVRRTWGDPMARLMRDNLHVLRAGGAL
jgi:hypothetical protein